MGVLLIQTTTGMVKSKRHQGQNHYSSVDRSQNVTDGEKCFVGMNVSESIVTMDHSSGIHTTDRETVPSRSGEGSPSREQPCASYPNLVTHPNLVLQT